MPREAPLMRVVQTIPDTLELLRRGKEESGLSNSEIARRAGVTEGSIRFLLAGVQSRGKPYYGMTPRRRGEEALLFRVINIINDELARQQNPNTIRRADLEKAIGRDMVNERDSFARIRYCRQMPDDLRISRGA